MKFTKIRLIGLTVVDLPIRGASPLDTYILKAADGLGPPEVGVSISNAVNQGGIYLGRRPLDREPVIRVGLNPDYMDGQTPAELREAFYGMLMTSDEATEIQIINDSTVIMQTLGYVKRIEIVPFNKDPEIQITFSCPDPYFEAPSLQTVTNLDLSVPTITNTGTAPTGFEMEVIFTPVESFYSWTISKAFKPEEKMEIMYPIAPNDRISFNTQPGSRSITHTNALDNSVRDITWSLSENSKWLMLHGGQNKFVTSRQDFAWGSVKFRPKYWGV